MSTFAAELEPISPELVLVSSPEEALRARAMLPPPPISTLDLLAARRRESPATVPDVLREPRRGRRPLLVALSLLLAAGVAFAWVQRPRPLRPYFAQPAAAERPVPAAPAAPAVQPVAAAEKRVASAPAPTAGRFVPSRVWVWSADATATGYLFELAREGSVVLRLHTTEPRLVLPRSFRFRAGTYRWSVRRIPSASAPPLTDSRFTLTGAAAALANR